MKIGLLFRHHCTTKVKKTRPYSNLDSRKAQKVFVKIEDTYQEEVSQATMAAPISNEVAQKIFKAMEEQNDVLKKMGSRFTKLEEAKLKKAAPVQVLDDIDVEDWDERDKVDYERNKEFEKLTAKAIAMREKMEKMQLAFRKTQGMDDCLYNMGGISLKTPYCTTSKVQDFRCRKV